MLPDLGQHLLLPGLKHGFSFADSLYWTCVSVNDVTIF